MKLFRLSLVAFCLFLLSLPALAQETVAWADYGLEIELSDDWEIDESGELAPLAVYNDDLGILFYEPWEDTEDIEEAAEIILDDEDNESIGFENDPVEIEIMGEDALQLPYTSDEWSGFLALFAFDGRVFILDAFVAGDSISSRDEEALLEVVQSIRSSEGSNNSSGDGDTIESARDEDSTGEDIVGELIDLDLVSDDGDFLFEEDEIEEGTFDFAEGYEGGKVAIAGWLSIEAAEDDEDYRFCTFVAQSTTDDAEAEEGTMLISGFDSTGFLLVYEYDIEDEDNSSFESFDPNVDTEDEAHVLVIIQDDELSAYVNGELIVEGWELDTTAGDHERFTGFIVGDGCSMTNVWAYTFD
jgi:hypothetical protein